MMLADSLKCLYATSFAFYIKAFGFHHNVEGDNFPQYHEFFGEIYTDVQESLDRLAEYIRVLDCYTPFSFQRFAELSKIQDQLKVPGATLMMEELYVDTEILLECIGHCFPLAQEAGEEGIANFLAERQDAMGKWRWQIRSILKTDRG